MREADMARYEASVVGGLEPFAIDELRASLPRARVTSTSREGRIDVRYAGDPGAFAELSTVTAMHAVCEIEGARPSVLLGHASFSLISEVARWIMAQREAFATMRLSAAGSDTALMRRIRDELARATGLEATAEPADLELSLRRGEGSQGWELLLRLTPRPLATRAWRVCDYPGALNATVANVMVRLAQPRPDDVFVNLCCGSGTLIAERQRLRPAKALLGIDNNEAALACARQNLASEGANQAALILADATRAPLPDSIASAVVMDPPFGMLQGRDESNLNLYAELFAEASRLLRAGGSFVMVSTRRQLVRSVIESQGNDWEVIKVVDLRLAYDRGYITPSIYALKRL